MYLGFFWLAMANCCVNPVIYYCWNKRSVNTQNLLRGMPHEIEIS
jgi:hypothetical protein